MSARKAFICKWLFCTLLSFIGFYSRAQLSADFSATPAYGCSPLVVSFSDVSSGNPTEWKWDLGNGTVSYLRNPSVTYFAPGQYNIKLIVSNSVGIDSLVKSQYITVYSNPDVNFSGSSTTGCFPLPVQFTDSSGPGSGSIELWEWDLGDGAISSIANPPHIYKGAGNFNVSLRVTNSFGCVTSITRQQYVNITTGVLADFTNNIPNSCKAPAAINFTNRSSGNGALSYEWDFGDGTGSTLTDPPHIYTAAGSYTVRLIAKNSIGCIDTLTGLNAITIGNTNVDFFIPSGICRESNLIISNTSTPLPASVIYNFGDGTTSTNINPVKTYASAGNYIIKMIANFGGCLDSISKLINVLAQPSINFTADRTNDCKIPLNVNFTSDVIGAISYAWDFGDGNSSTDKDPKHIYNNTGKYDVKLIATNAAGCSDTLIKPAYIQVQLPQVSILSLPAKGCAPFFYSFTSKVITTDPVVTYKWDFGDGSTSSMANPSHTFVLPGSYTISIIVTTARGCTDTAIIKGGIIAGTKPDANFSGDPTDACANVPINFSDLSTGKVDKWFWQFGDSSTSIEQNPKHEYQDTGYFTVKLIVLNNGCADTILFNNYIHIKPPIAKFLIANNCALPLQKVFTDQSIGADTWEWDFGDGTTSTISSTLHTYALTGNYTVKLKVSNLTTGCISTSTQTVSVINERATFIASDYVICKNTVINFTPGNIDPVNIASYNWNFGDGTGILSDTGLVTHIYKIAGTYSVTMIITDITGCKDTLVKPLYMQVDGPTAAFKPSTPGTCLNNTITFIDSSYTDGVHAIQEWILDYGDGINETFSAPPFQHTYSAPGIFIVKLKVIDSNGCADSLVKINALVISKPVAEFTAKDSVSCPQKQIVFANTSTGPTLTYLWDFGDGTTSTQLNPSHQYITEGLFSVSLAIKDKYGCTDYSIRAGYIKIVNPVASFLMSDSITSCPPLVVTFTNTSANEISRSWDFGDGSGSLLNDPSHFYAFPGVYNVTLTITSPGGCTDKKTKQIIVNGPQGSFTYTNIVGCTPLQTNFKATTKDNLSFIWDFNDGTTVVTKDSILSHVYTNPGIYLPKMILIDARGCEVPITGSDTIIVYGVEANFTASTTTVCDSGMVRFTDNSVSNDLITSYSWNFGDGSISNQQHPVYSYKKSGSYSPKLIVTTQSGCKDSAIIAAQVKVVNSPEIVISATEGACVPATLNFSAKVLVTDTSALTWNWNFGNGNTSSLQNPPAQVYTLANSYIVKLTVVNSSGCIAIADKTVQAYPLPDLRTNADSYICKGQSISLSVTGAASYSWTPAAKLSCTNCANPVAKPDSATQYVIKGTSVNSCIAFDSVLVSVKYPFTLQVSKADSLCEGSSTRVSARGTDTYMWSPSTGLNNVALAQPTANPSVTTNYRVIGTDDIGCFADTGYVLIQVFPLPTVNAGEDKTINVGQSLELIPDISSDVNKVVWSPTSGIFRNSYPGISIKPNESTEYTVEVSNPGSCMARDRISVYVLCNNTNVFVPNTFSPNTDGINDILYPRGSGVFQIKVFRVFNRWGDVVFEKSNLNANDISAGWDGTYKGQKLLPDIFVYAMNVVCDNNTILTFKGNIALIR